MKIRCLPSLGLALAVAFTLMLAVQDMAGGTDSPELTNQPPMVHIVTPLNGATFFSDSFCPPCATNVPPCEAPCYLVPPNVPICADARDTDGYVVTVEFFADNLSLGIRTNLCPLCVGPVNPFCLTWSNVPPGNHVLTAKATDNDGATGWSDPVQISVDSPPRLPVVTILATDPLATEIPLVPPGMGMPQRIDSARFTVSRTGGTDLPLDVLYKVSGTASNGVDYEKLTGKVTIPAGAQSAIIEVMPIDDLLVEGTETVVVTLPPIACIAIYSPAPGCYQVGSPDRATAYILDNDSDTNSLPVVSITAPDPIASEGTNCYQIMIYPPPTNNPCITNTATFVVRRTGPTNDALTVNYCIGGMASNGVDYVELPGMVTISAGKRAAPILIVPLDDSLPEKVETVVLKLCVPPTALTVVPSYLIGFPSRAAAIIVDNDCPRPGTGPLPDRCFHWARPGTNGTWWRIECSTDMINWTPVGTTPVMDGALDFVDPDADQLPSRFYRAVPEMNPPTDLP